MTRIVEGSVVRYNRHYVDTFAVTNKRPGDQAKLNGPFVVKDMEHLIGVADPVATLEDGRRVSAYWLELYPDAHHLLAMMLPLKPDWRRVRREHRRLARAVKR